MKSLGILRHTVILTLSLSMSQGCADNLCRQEKEEDIQMVHLDIGLDGSDVKSMESCGAEVNGWVVYVCDPDGEIEGFGSAESVDDGISLEVLAGDYIVCAFVNHNGGDAGECVNVNSVLSDPLLLSGEQMGHFRMFCREEVSIKAESCQIMLNVRRKVAKVQVDMIDCDFSENKDFLSMDFILNGIYLINAAGSCMWNSDAEPSIWYNRMGYEEGGEEMQFLCNCGIGHDLKKRPYTDRTVLYTYPNPVIGDVSGGGSFTPRYTRLVVEASLGGVVYYYAVNLPGIRSNCLYHIEEITLTGSGSLDPDDPSECDTKVKFSVMEWDEKETVNEIS